MNRFNWITIGLLLAGFGASAAVQAQDAVDERSWYMGPTINLMDADGRFGVDRIGSGLGFRMGKELSPRWDMQIGLTHARTSSGSLSYSQSTLGIDALYMFTRDTIRPFLLVGTGLQHDNAHFVFGGESSTRPYVSAGIGLQADVNERVTIQADVRHLHGILCDCNFGFDRSGNNYLTVGLNFRLGRTAERVVQAAPVEVPPPVVIPEARVIVLEDVHFAFDSSELSPSTQAALKRNIAILKNNPGAEVRIAGYTSASGTEQYNQALSERRARAVEAFLIREGVALPDRLSTIGYGQDRPAQFERRPDEIDSRAARANMRVLFEIILR
ncbi:MAG: OmpA family protein [Gammaproteobacteria bacterium]